MKNLKVGDRVILKADHPYGDGESNPREGSKWFCEGWVVSICTPWVTVKWDNNLTNSYEIDTNCLELADNMEVCI